MAEEVHQKTNVDLMDIARGIMVNPSWQKMRWEDGISVNASIAKTAAGARIWRHVKGGY